jgi:hypothetical protein
MLGAFFFSLAVRLRSLPKYRRVDDDQGVCYSCPSLRFLKINQPINSAASARNTKNQFIKD